MTTTVSVKIPARILERIPKAGQGRSGFIVEALEEKLERQPRQRMEIHHQAWPAARRHA